MSVKPSLVISIDRTALSLDALEISGTGTAGELVLTDYSDPAQQARINYAPDAYFTEGSVALSSVWQQTILPFSVMPYRVANETAARSLIAELKAALAQFSFMVSVTVDGAPAEQWACDQGSMQLAAPRSLADLRDNNPVWSVTVPCRPTPA